ncbi:hypothetical protein N7478_007218 [Penicillium angulare]|uniref:uncharacterized protein n=1 Tax=Penicillium angulare TaxID=116970 RepID=UPI00254034C2|nr:uncharacterized protein N7478_007218 [Penicillium angulare]KAJ5281846.1 hypothetical protein N7478_007218 [Penicillium angulare]
MPSSSQYASYNAGQRQYQQGYPQGYQGYQGYQKDPQQQQEQRQDTSRSQPQQQPQYPNAQYSQSQYSQAPNPQPQYAQAPCSRPPVSQAQYSEPYPQAYPQIQQQYPQQYPQPYPLQQYPQQYPTGYQNDQYQQYPAPTPVPEESNAAEADPILRPSSRYGKRPCVIPQVTKVFGGSFFSPFVRVRAPELEETYPIPEAKFLQFLDGLNEAFIANPALQAADGVGNILGFIPSITTQVVGGGLNIVAGFGTVGVSKGRTRSYLKKANLEIWNPIGVHAQVLKTEKMLALAGIPKEKNPFNPKTAGDGVNSLMPAGPPSANGVGIPTTQLPPPPTEQDMKVAIKKRMDLLGDNVMPLTFNNVAPPTEQTNWMKKMGAKAAAEKEKEQLNEMHGISDRGDVKEAEEDVQELQAQMDAINIKMQRASGKKAKDLQKDMEDVQKDMRTAQEELQKELEKAHKADDKIKKKQQKGGGKVQAKQVNGQRWLVIAPKDQCFADDDLEEDGSDSKAGETTNAGSGQNTGGEKKRHWWSRH